MVTPEQQALAAAAHAAATTVARPSLGAIWSALAAVPDPEIPVLSVLDLGIVRSVEWDAADPLLLLVRVTPTYSGCPATDVITDSIRTKLAEIGVPALRVDIVLSPPWSTAYLTPDGERKLRAYGIASPGSASPGGTARVDVRGLAPLRRTAVQVACPRCGSLDTALIAQFGSTACKAHYRCNACLEPFDFFKPL